MKNNNIIKHQAIVFTISIIFICLFLLGTSYALFIKINENKTNQVIKTGDLSVKYESGNEIIIDKDEKGKSLIVPMIDEDGLKTDKYNFSITNNGTITASYRISIFNGEGNNLVNWKYIRYSIDGKKPDFLSNVSDNLLFANNIKPGQTINFSLQFWIWLEYDESTGKYTGAPNEIEGQSIFLSLDVSGNVYKCIENKLSDVTKEIASKMEKYCNNDYLTYYYLEPAENNYVFFANNLWRIIRINEDGSIRIISNTIISQTAYSFDTNINNAYALENTELYYKLDEYYNNNLSEYKDYLVKSNYCIDGINSYNDYNNNNKNLSCISYNESYVGLLSIKEFALLNKNSYMINESYWIYNVNNNLEFSIINEDGNYDIYDSKNSNGLRPVISIKDGLIKDGNGSINNPYIIN